MKRIVKFFCMFLSSIMLLNASEKIVEADTKTEQITMTVGEKKKIKIGKNNKIKLSKKGIIQINKKGKIIAKKTGKVKKGLNVQKYNKFLKIKIIKRKEKKKRKKKGKLQGTAKAQCRGRGL